MRSDGKILKRIESLIRELKVEKRADANKYEGCETIARLAPKEVVDLIDDPKIKEGITWLKRVHGNIPEVATWRRAFAKTILSLFEEAGGMERVKKWHALEGLCDKVPEKELKKIDKNLREAIMWVKRVHDSSPERRLKIIKKTSEYCLSNRLTG